MNVGLSECQSRHYVNIVVIFRHHQNRCQRFFRKVFCIATLSSRTIFASNHCNHPPEDTLHTERRLQQHLSSPTPIWTRSVRTSHSCNTLPSIPIRRSRTLGQPVPSPKRRSTAIHIVFSLSTFSSSGSKPSWYARPKGRQCNPSVSLQVWPLSMHSSQYGLVRERLVHVGSKAW